MQNIETLEILHMEGNLIKEDEAYIMKFIEYNFKNIKKFNGLYIKPDDYNVMSSPS